MDGSVKFNEDGVLSMSSPLTFNKTMHKFVIGDGLVTIDMQTGEHTFGPNYTPDEAAKIFWEAMTRMRPGSG